MKDNIDVRGVPTTVACPEFAYLPDRDAEVVRRLVEAGARIVGKTNLDQFATGLVGTRSPYGVVPNVHNPAYVSGGSSSGSASLVARGLVPLALGTDTAGSGRVPAGLNGIVGLKPTRGWFSFRGVFPACRSLDCVSILTARVRDAALVAWVLGGFDPEDPYARSRPPREGFSVPHRRLAVPSTLPWFGDDLQSRAWDEALVRWKALGYALVSVDPQPLFAMAALLYEGPWVAERVNALRGFYPARADQIHPVVRTILDGAARFDAASAFWAEDRRRELARTIAGLWEGCDALLVPAVPTVYTIQEVLADPLVTNARLGTWTNFVNLADLCALVVPAGTRADGLPFGVTLLGQAWEDDRLAALGEEWERWSDEVMVAVAGAHLSGLPLNPRLTRRGARLVRTGPDLGSVPAARAGGPVNAQARPGPGGQGGRCRGGRSLGPSPGGLRGLRRRGGAAVEHWHSGAGRWQAGPGVPLRSLGNRWPSGHHRVGRLEGLAGLTGTVNSPGSGPVHISDEAAEAFPPSIFATRRAQGFPAQTARLNGPGARRAS